MEKNQLTEHMAYSAQIAPFQDDPDHRLFKDTVVGCCFWIFAFLKTGHLSQQVK